MAAAVGQDGAAEETARRRRVAVLFMTEELCGAADGLLLAFPQQRRSEEGSDRRRLPCVGRRRLVAHHRCGSDRRRQCTGELCEHVHISRFAGRQRRRRLGRYADAAGVFIKVNQG